MPVRQRGEQSLRRQRPRELIRMAPQLGIQELIGHKLIDQDGNNVGKIGQVYRDDQTHQPTWVTVQTGLFGNQESFVPLAGAEITDQDLRVPFSKSLIKDSPR